MRVFPVEFIDSQWFDKIKHEVDQVKTEILGVKIMYENITKFLEKNDKDKEKIIDDITELNSKIETMDSSNKESISSISLKFDKLLAGLEQLSKDIDTQNKLFESYKFEHKVKHEEHVSLLDLIFGR